MAAQRITFVCVKLESKKRILSISDSLTVSENEYDTLTTVMDSNYWIAHAMLIRHQRK